MRFLHARSASVILAALLFGGQAARAGDGCWTNWSVGSNGALWGDAGNWTNTAGVNALPDRGHALLTVTNGAYTVFYNSAQPAITNLIVENRAPYRTELLVSAPLTSLGGAAIRLRGGVSMTLTNGALWNYEGTNGVTDKNESMVSIRDGGELIVAGGMIAFTNQPIASTAFGNYLNVGYQSTGTLRVTGGRLDYYESGFPKADTNNNRALRIGRGAGGSGLLEISGGSVTLGKETGSLDNEPLLVGVGNDPSGTRGSVIVSGGELVMTNASTVTVGSYYGHGVFIVTNSGSVKMNLGGNNRFYVGRAPHGNGLLRIDGGSLRVNDGIVSGYSFFSYSPTSCTGGLEVTAGLLACGSSLVSGFGQWGSAPAYGFVNIYGGRVSEEYWGVHVGRAYQGGTGIGRLTITNGLLDVISAAVVLSPTGSGGNEAHAGIAIGAINHNDTAAASRAWGLMTVAGSAVVSNSGVLVIGVCGGTGTLVQTGGAIRHVPQAPAANKFTILGYGTGSSSVFGGGCGTYELSGGSYTTPNRVFVGGVPTNVQAYSRGGGVGLLKISGGSFTITNSSLMVGGYGTGTLTLGANGSCSVKDLILTNNTQSTLRCELGPAGAGTLTASGALNIDPATKLEVDSTAFTGGVSRIRLVDCASRYGSFDPARISVTGPGEVRQDIDEDIWLQFPSPELIARERQAAFFALIDFDNYSLTNRNPGLRTVRTLVTNAAAQPSDTQALTLYASAMSNLWALIPAKYSSCGPSRVLADSSTFASNFFSWIDLDHPGLETTKAFVEASNYSAALEAWRDYTVDKLRRKPALALYQQSYKGNPRQTNLASRLLGQKSDAQYLADGTNFLGGVDFYEIYGMSGAPGTIGPIAWTNQPATTNTALDSKYSYFQFFFASSLLYRYWAGETLGRGNDVTLAAVGSTVTATLATPHGLVSGAYVVVAGASPAAYNGLFRVTVVNANTLAYTALASPGSSPATGSGRSVAHARQDAPVQKWFEILADFSTRQKNMVAALLLFESKANQTAYRTIWGSSDWSGNAGAVLGQGDRVAELLAALTLFSKLLPEETPQQRDWNTASLEPATNALAAGAQQQIPAEALARVALSLMADNSESLLLSYFRAGWFPNQRLNGLRALFLSATFLDEFKAAPELLRQVDAALTDFANTSFYPDGAMLERSPNYNAGDADKIRLLVKQAGTNAIPAIQVLSDHLAAYERVLAFMQTPYGGPPRMASDSGYNPTELWLGGATLDAWRTRFRNWVSSARDATATNLYLGMLDSGAPVPSATSVAFPYAGYYLMRNGWSSRSHYLYFANTPPGNGHSQMDMNGIQVAAFGRSLLSTGGPPPYDPTFVVTNQYDDYAGFALYQGEGSSFKVNTVSVDGRSQNESYVRNAAVTTTPTTNAWFTSPEFDYVEGVYSAGYGCRSSNEWLHIYDAFTNSYVMVTSVTHTRSVAFLRDPGIWIVTDRVAARDAARHDYRQIWNFPAQSATTGPTYGFATNEVVADPETLHIRTTDADGPNLHLYHLGPQAVTYATYAASRTPYLGWSGNGIDGLRLPAVNVHAVWQGVGTQLLVTVIAPSDTGAASPISSIHTNASSATTIDMELALANGHTLRIVQGLQAQSLTLGGQSLSARTVIVDAAPDGTHHGLALTAAGFAVSNFSFTATTTDFLPLVAIGRPTNFVWSSDGDWLQPSPAAPQNTPPQLSAIADQRLLWNTASPPLAFTIGDAETQAAHLTVTAQADDPLLLPEANFLVAGDAAARTLVLTPATNRRGTTRVTLTVTDPQGAAQSVAFDVVVIATHNLLPYRESFESLAPGSWLLELDGWDGAVAEAGWIATDASLLESLYAAEPVIGFPLRHDTHDRVAYFDTTVTNSFTATSGSVIWSDLMLYLMRDPFPALRTPLPSQTALALNANGWLHLWHRDVAGASNRWSALAWQTAVSAAWVRVTLQLDYATPDPVHDCRYFRLYLDGAAQSNDLGFTTNNGSGVPGGPWFAMAEETTPTTLNALVFVGNGAMDDLVVDTVRPLIGLGPRGTPEWWLADRGLTNGNGLAANELEDADTDRYLNWQEFAARTDPLDPESLLRFVALPPDVDARRPLVAQVVVGQRYTLEATTNLAFAAWQAAPFSLATEIPPTAQTVTAAVVSLTLYVDPALPGRFYRLRKLP